MGENPGDFPDDMWSREAMAPLTKDHYYDASHEQLAREESPYTKTPTPADEPGVVEELGTIVGSQARSNPARGRPRGRPRGGSRSKCPADGLSASMRRITRSTAAEPARGGPEGGPATATRTRAQTRQVVASIHWLTDGFSQQSQVDGPESSYRFSES